MKIAHWQRVVVPEDAGGAAELQRVARGVVQDEDSCPWVGMQVACMYFTLTIHFGWICFILIVLFRYNY